MSVIVHVQATMHYQMDTVNAHAVAVEHEKLRGGGRWSIAGAASGA